MKIAFMLYSFPTLSGTFILNQITGLIERGHHVDIYAFKPGDTKEEHEHVEKYDLLDRTYYWPVLPSNAISRHIKAVELLFSEFRRHPKFVLQFFGTLKYLKHVPPLLLLWTPMLSVGRRHYDIIHGHFGPNGVKGALLRKLDLMEGKLITTFHGYDINRHQFGKHYYAWLFRQGDLYTANTSFTAKRAVRLGCPPDRITILPAGIDISKYSFKPRQFPSDGPVNIMTVARLAEEKGIKYSVRAIAKVMETHPNIRYQIIGDGHLRESIKKLVADLDVLDKVELMGWKTADELTRLYDNAHIFVLPSIATSDGDQEGQGLVLQEAQAAGLPVLSTLVGGIPEGMIDGKSGFLVPEQDIDALSEKLTYLIEHPELWPDMGHVGRKFVEDSYDIERLNDKLVDIYKRLLQRESS
jgi:colanic acid/amylovoran biosynthesis glycosyltransferase